MEKRWLMAVALTLVAALVWIASSAWSGGKSSPLEHATAHFADESVATVVRPQPIAIQGAPQPTPPALPTAPTLSAPTPSAGLAPVEAAVAAPSESQIMAKLHELGETNPEASLALARQGNAQFPDSPDAPERGWIVVKALTNMRRFDDAHAEAESMVRQYRGTSWANDVERHVLVVPP